MTTINLLSPLLFYQNPVDIYQTQEGSTQVNGIPNEITSCRGCDKNLSGNNPASQYQRQKIIQKSVRVQSSLYTMNLASLSGYQSPLNRYQTIEQNGSVYFAPPRVYWNQMSDRSRPSIQKCVTGSGSTYHGSSTKHSITRNRPGAMSPGGVGVDIKHNSYDRYLNKIKGKGPIRRGIIPPNYGQYIPFNNAYPIYGGKIIKTGIVSGCDCESAESNKLIYASALNAIQDQILSIGYKFNVGDFVWVKKLDGKLYKAEIIEINNGLYNVKFTDDDSTEITTIANLYIYFNCDCTNELSLKEKVIANQSNYKNLIPYFEANSNIYCKLLNILAESEIL